MTKFITISGGPRVGKTYLAARLMKMLEEKGSRTITWHSPSMVFHHEEADVVIIDDPYHIGEATRHSLMKDNDTYNILISSRHKNDRVHKDIIYHMERPITTDLTKIMEWLK